MLFYKFKQLKRLSLLNKKGEKLYDEGSSTTDFANKWI